MLNGLIKRTTETPATAEPPRPASTLRPPVDITENAQELLLFADMPGVDEKSVDIELNGHNLMIRGKVAPAVANGYTAIYAECRPGDYERSFTLGDTIDREGIKAVMKDGILRLILPKIANAQARKIPVLVE
jgi:HSP20 family molecular chaperone IbpA